MTENKPLLKANLKYIKNLINNQTFLVEYPDKYEPVTPYMNVYKYKIKSDGSLDKLKLRIVVRGDLQNKEFVVDTWSPTSSVRTHKYFLADATKHVNFLGYSHFFMSIIISYRRYHLISVDQARYATPIVAKYLDTDTVQASTKFYKTTLPYDMIFTKDDPSTSDE